MMFTSSSLIALVLLSGGGLPNGIDAVSAFVPLPAESRTRHHPMATADASSPLPPSLPGTGATLKNGKKRRKSPNRRSQSSKNGKSTWEGPDIPIDIPKLSDIMKDTSIQDFSGEIHVSSPAPLHNNNNNGKDKVASLTGRNSRNANARQTKKPLSNTNNQTARSPHEEPRGEPWRANYRTSTRTQSRIKAAAAATHMVRRPAIERATAVLRTLLQTPPQKCNEANLVCALTLSAKAMMPPTPITKNFRSMLLQTLDVLRQLVIDERLNARQLCNAVWAVAKHYNRDPTILPPPPETTAMSTEDMVGVAEAWILQAESDDTVEQRVKETLDVIATQLTNILQNEEPNAPKKPKVGELCMASWAYGVLRPRRRPPGWAVPPQMGRIPQGRAPKPRNVEFITFEQWTNTEQEDNTGAGPADSIDRLFDAVGEALCRQEASADDECVLGPPLLESCTWSEIANVAWAYASHGYSQTPSAEKAMRGLAQEATHRLHESHHTVLPRDVAQLVWAIGTLQSDNFRLSDDLQDLVNAIARHWEIGESTAGRTDRPLQQWSCPDLVQLAISLAHGRIDHLPLLRAVFEEALCRLEDTAHDAYSQQDTRQHFRTWEVSVLLWAQARLYLRESQGDIFETFASEAPTWLFRQQLNPASGSLEDIGIGPQEQANLAWSLTVLEQYNSKEATGLLKGIFQEASLSSEKRHIIQLEHAHQLWQALYMLEENCPSAVEEVPRWFRDYLQEKWSVEKARRKKSSARHRSLSDTLTLMNVAHYNEHDEDIDVAIVLKEDASWTHQTRRGDDNGYKVAVEFDGPNHFTRDTVDANGTKKSPRALGHTVLKYRLLKREGWTVVRVPYYEFDKIPFWASMERQRYLQRLLKTHAKVRFSDIDISEYSAQVSNRKSRFD